MVHLTVDGRQVTGFIDARQQRDGVWEAWVDFSFVKDDGFMSHRKDWFPMDQLEVVMEESPRPVR